MTWTQRPTDADWDALIAKLRASESVVCVAHVSPDGDALGSAMGAALAMRALVSKRSCHLTSNHLSFPAPCGGSLARIY